MSEHSLGKIEWGVAAQAYPGEVRSGDNHFVQTVKQGAFFAVIDGLGHGEKAADVADLTVETLGQIAQQPLRHIFDRCHNTLRGTRGVVMSVAHFNFDMPAMTWIGVGNVMGVLLQGQAHQSPRRETLLPRGGVVGYRLPNLHPITIFVKPGDTLVFATDGIRSGFSEVISLNDTPQQIADTVLTEYGRGTDDALVLVAQYAGN